MLSNLPTGAVWSIGAHFMIKQTLKSIRDSFLAKTIWYDFFTNQSMGPHSQSMTKVDLGQVLPCWSNVSQLRFDQQVSQLTTLENEWPWPWRRFYYAISQIFSKKYSINWLWNDLCLLRFDQEYYDWSRLWVHHCIAEVDISIIFLHGWPCSPCKVVPSC